MIYQRKFIRIILKLDISSFINIIIRSLQWFESVITQACKFFILRKRESNALYLMFTYKSWKTRGLAV